MTQVQATGVLPDLQGRAPAMRHAPAPEQRRRRPRISAADREIFLTALSEVYSVTHAAALTGRDKRRYYDLRDADRAFAEAWREAFAAGTEMLEDELRRRALEGWDEDTFDGDGKLLRRVHRMASNDLVTMLKKRDPSYRDNAKIELAGSLRNEVTAEFRNDSGLTMTDVLRFAMHLGPDVHETIVGSLIRTLERRGELTTEGLEQINAWCRQAEQEPELPMLALPPGEVST